MAAICGRILEIRPTFQLTSALRSRETCQGLGFSRRLRQIDRHTETLLPALLARGAGRAWQTCISSAPGQGEVAGPLGEGRGRRLGESAGCTHSVYQVSLPPLDSGYAASLSCSPLPPHFVTSALTWPLRTTCIFSPSPLFVSLKIIPRNPSCASYLCQGRLEWSGRGEDGMRPGVLGTGQRGLQTSVRFLRERNSRGKRWGRGAPSSPTEPCG